MSVELTTSNDRTISAVISIVLHVGILLLIWFFMKFQYPDPPMGATAISVSVARQGNTYSAGGTSPNESRPQTTPQQTSNPVQTEESMTTTDQDSPVQVQETQDTPQQEYTPTPVNDDPVEEPSEPEPTVSDALGNALESLGQTGTSPGSGQDEGAGTQGSSDGKIDGTGVVSGGEGFGYSLAGRGIRGKPDVNGNPVEEGTVVFDIWVDREGNLEKFKYNPILSTSGAGKNIAIAEKAMATVSFSANPNAKHIQKGQFTFVFKLN